MSKKLVINGGTPLRTTKFQVRKTITEEDKKADIGSKIIFVIPGRHSIYTRSRVLA